MKCTTWYLKSYRFRSRCDYFGNFHSLIIFFISINTSKCNLHSNKIFRFFESSFWLFWNICFEKSSKIRVNFGSLIWTISCANFHRFCHFKNHSMDSHIIRWLCLIFLWWKYEIKTTSSVLHVRFRQKLIAFSVFWNFVPFFTFLSIIGWYLFCQKCCTLRTEKTKNSLWKSILHLVDFSKPSWFFPVAFYGSFKCFRHIISPFYTNSCWK